MKDLRALLIHEIQDLHSAEIQCLEELPRMEKAVNSQYLKQVLQQQYHETRGQIQRLEYIAKRMQCPAQDEPCKGMAGLISEEKKMRKSDAPPEVMDAALIAADQRMEHYKIAGYGTARMYAQMIGDNDTAELLGRNLSEDKHRDHALSEVAISRINERAVRL